MDLLNHFTAIINLIAAIITLGVLVISLVSKKRKEKKTAYKGKREIFYKVLRVINFFLWCIGIGFLLMFKSFETAVWFFIGAEILFIYEFIRDKTPTLKIDIVVLVVWTSAICLLVCLYVMTKILNIVVRI